MQIIDEKYIVIGQCFTLFNYNDHVIEQFYENKQILKTTIANDDGGDYIIKADLKHITG
jgi:hypothetical protein